MGLEERLILVILALFMFLISFSTGAAGRKKARKFDWEAYTSHVIRQKGGPRYKFTSAQIIEKAKASKGYVVGVDTNVLIEDYRILEKLVDEHISVVVSNKVRQELDGLKRHDDEQLREQARLALKSIYNLELEKQLEIVDVFKQPNNEHVLQGLDLHNPDELIIASYLSYERPVIFFTNDNNARLTAKQFQLHVQELHEEDANEDPFKIKPGNSLKWASLVSYCIATGLTFVLFANIVEVYSKDKEPAAPLDVTSAETAEATFVKDGLNVDASNRFIVKSEYDTLYYGVYNETWGGVVLLDHNMRLYERLGSDNNVYTFDFGFFIKDDKLRDFSDVMKVKISDGQLTADEKITLEGAGGSTKVQFSSTEARIAIDGINSAEQLYYQAPTGQDNAIPAFDLSKTTITFYNSVTNEVIFTLPAQVQSEQLKEGN